MKGVFYCLITTHAKSSFKSVPNIVFQTHCTQTHAHLHLHTSLQELDIGFLSKFSQLICVGNSVNCLALVKLTPEVSQFRKATKRSRMQLNSTKRTKTSVQGPMGWIGCICCQKFRRDFVAQTFALVRPVSHRVSKATKRSQMHPNSTKRSKTLVQGPLGWIRRVHS